VGHHTLGADAHRTRVQRAEQHPVVALMLELRAADVVATSPPIRGRLDVEPVPDDAGAVTERVISLTSSTSIDNRSMDMSRIDHIVEADTDEIWTVTNRDALPHNFHVHDVQFHVLAVDGRPPPPALTGRHDTVFVAPGGSVRLLVAFGTHADGETPYMFHCHLTRHEDDGMMGQFTVVGPGATTAAPPR